MRSRWSALVGLVGLAGLAGCPGNPPAPPPARPVAVAPPPPPPPACVRVPDEAVAITHASGDLARIRYCIGDGTDQCFALELASGALSRLDAPPPATPARELPRVEATNPELKICNGSDCKTLTPMVWPGAAPLHVATNGAFAVVLLGDAEGGKGYAEVWDVAKAKKAATIHYAHGDFKCGEVAMLGDSIYLGASTCTSPSARAALYTLKGRKIGNVGVKDFGTYGNAFVQVDGATWAFLEENGNRIAVQDVVKGKVVKTLDVSDLWRTDPAVKGDAMGNPGESALVALGPAKLAVIAGAPANGSVAVIDVNSGEVWVTRAPLCH